MKRTWLIALSILAVVGAIIAGFISIPSSVVASSSLGSPGVDPANFKDGSLTQPITQESCTLTNGDETMCYRIIVTGQPVDTTIGPFCPETTSTSADDAGIWLDGSKIYDADRQFILDLSDIYRRVPGRKSRRGSDRSGDLVRQCFHGVAEDRTVIGIGVKVEIPPGRSKLVFHCAQ